MSQRTILLLRHAEALKNVEDRHGGEGTSLTKRGRLQCDILASYIRDTYSPLKSALLIGHRIPQVMETAELLGRFLNIPIQLDDILKGLDLGSVAGLSRLEAANLYPEAAKRLELWRQGKLKIDELKLPDGEPFEEFFSRISTALNNWRSLTQYDLIIVVCTRSVLIMLVNLVVLGSKFNTEEYQPYEFRHLGLTKIVLTRSEPTLEFLDDIDYLDEGDRQP